MENSIVSSDAIRPKDFDLFAGMDVDKKKIVITILDHDKTVATKTIPYDTDNIVNYFLKRYKNKKISFVYEAGPTGYGLYDRLVDAGYTCLVTCPSKVPVIPGSRVKTNRLDSVKLAESLRGSQIRGIRVPDNIYRSLRHLVHLRDTFVRQSSATKCRIKALLLMEGLSFPNIHPNSQWSRAVLNQLKVNKTYQIIRFKLDRLLESLEFFHQQAINTQREIRRICKTDNDISESISYLKSIPGIGWIIASEMIIRIGDWRLLKNVRELGAFLGLTPSEDSTGDREKRGHITKNGCERLRNKLIEGSWAAIRKDGELAEFYKKVYFRHPRNCAARKAIVAVARKLTCRIYRVLKDRRLYEIRVSAEKNVKIDNGEKRHNALGDDSSVRRTIGSIARQRPQGNLMPFQGVFNESAILVKKGCHG